jgi:hypothetical protein
MPIHGSLSLQQQQVNAVNRSLPNAGQPPRHPTYPPKSVALMKSDIRRLAHTFIYWTRINMSLIIEGVL